MLCDLIIDSARCEQYTVHGVNSIQCTLWTVYSARCEQYTVHGANSIQRTVRTVYSARCEQYTAHGVNSIQRTVWTVYSARCEQYTAHGVNNINRDYLFIIGCAVYWIKYCTKCKVRPKYFGFVGRRLLGVFYEGRNKRLLWTPCPSVRLWSVINWIVCPDFREIRYQKLSNELQFRENRLPETVWHFDSKERLVKMCIIRHEVRHYSNKIWLFLVFRY
jgi:hypothetical protein